MQVRTLLATTAATAAVSLLPISAQAASFGTNGIEFDQTTIVQFTFDSSYHFYASQLAVYTASAVAANPLNPGLPSQVLFQESKPTSTTDSTLEGCSVLIGSPSSCTINFTFQGGVTYTLGLSNINPKDGTRALSPIVYSTSAFNTAAYLNATSSNPNGTRGLSNQQAVFGSGGSPTDGPNPPFNPVGGLSAYTERINQINAGQTVQIGFDDGGWDGTTGVDLFGNPVYTVSAFSDRDFNDFVFSAKVIPAPPLLMGLIALGTRVFFRQRKTARA